MIVKNIFTVFFIPLILGGIARKLIIGFKGEKYFASRVKPGTGTVSAAGILLLIFMVMAQERNTTLMENFGALLLAVIPIFLYYLFMYGASVFWMKQLVKRGAVDGKKALVLVYTSVARHINISMAIALSSFAVDQAAAVMFVLIIAYLIQVPGLAFFAQNYGKNFISRTAGAAG
jgi:ACR3 family arsenite efflux pump ArsB